jgi:outer membrane protein OmpA-like peptidoglycan-associated protein
VDEFGVEINESYLIRKAKEDSIKFRGDTVYLRVTNERSVDTKPAIIAAPVVVPSAQEEPAPAEIKPAGEAIPVETKPATETPAETKPSTEVLPVDAPAVEVPKTPENPAPAEVKPEEKPEKKANEGLDINVSSKKPFILKGLNFKSQSFDLSNESKVYLDQVIAYIKANPSMKFEIGGHTDNTGGKGLNQRLSYDRAKSVYFYLISKGISKSRLSYEGYGSTFPIAPNTTAEGKAKNRRIELKLAK